MEITREGTQFVEYAQKIIALCEEARYHVADCSQESLCIGGCEVTLTYCMGDLFSDFCETYPRIRLATMTGANSLTPELVKNGTVEIGIFYTLDEEKLKGLNARVFLKEPISLVTSYKNAISSHANVHYENLQGMNFVFPHHDCYAAVEILRELHERGIQIGKSSYLGMMQLVLEQVKQRGDIVALPLSAARYLCRTRGLVTIDLQEKPVILYARILYKNKQTLSPHGKLLLEHCIQYGAKLLELEQEDHHSIFSKP